MVWSVTVPAMFIFPARVSVTIRVFTSKPYMLPSPTPSLRGPGSCVLKPVVSIFTAPERIMELRFDGEVILHRFGR